MTEQTHVIEIAGIGNFTFRRRVMRSEFQIGAEYSRLTEGVAKPSAWLDIFATAFATLKVLTTEAPAGWNLDDMDPADDETYRKIMEVFGQLRAAEDRFRLGNGTAGANGGAVNGGNNSALVPPPLPAAPQ